MSIVLPQPKHFSSTLLAIARSVNKYSCLQAKQKIDLLKIAPVSNLMAATPKTWPTATTNYTTFVPPDRNNESLVKFAAAQPHERSGPLMANPNTIPNSVEK